MSRAIVTFGVGKHCELLDIARPSYRAFADLHGWDYYEAQDIGTSRPPPWYKVQALLGLLPEYDEVLFLGCDMVIVDGSEDLIVNRLWWQALVEHHTGGGGGDVPNTDMWLCRKAMIPVLEKVWSMKHWLMHGWWEQAALMELMGYGHNGVVWFRGKWNELMEHTFFLSNEWNVHKWDKQQPDHPRIQHATMYPDRVAVMKQWAKEAEQGWMSGIHRPES